MKKHTYYRKLLSELFNKKKNNNYNLFRNINIIRLLSSNLRILGIHE